MRSLVVLALAACGDDGGSTEPLFATDYRATYMEVRNCRASSDHDLNKIRIVADPTSLQAYTTRAVPFPVGSIVIKEEYDFADTTCSGAIVQWTVMKKLETAWTWQRVSKTRDVESVDEARCINCHTNCGRPPDGYDFTCAVP